MNKTIQLAALLLALAFILPCSAQTFQPGDTAITTGVVDTFVYRGFGIFAGWQHTRRPIYRHLRIALDSFSAPYYTKGAYRRIEPARRQGNYWYLGAEGDMSPESGLLPGFVGYSGFEIRPVGPNIPAELPAIGDKAVLTRFGGGSITFTFTDSTEASAPTGERLRVDRGIFTMATCDAYEFSWDEASGLDYFAWRDSGDCKLAIPGWLEFKNRPRLSEIPGPHATDQERIVAAFGRQVWEPVARSMALDTTTAVTAVVNGISYPIYVNDADGGRFYSGVRPGEYFIAYSLTMRTGEESHRNIEVNYWGDDKRLDLNIELHFEGTTLVSNRVKIFIGDKQVL